MKRFRVELSRSASAEIAEAYAFICKDSPTNAARLHDGLLAAVRSLTVAPTRCPLAPENGQYEFEIRQRMYGNYRLRFTTADDRLIVLHVRHGARRPMRFDEIVPPDAT